MSENGNIRKRVQNVRKITKYQNFKKLSKYQHVRIWVCQRHQNDPESAYENVRKMTQYQNVRKRVRKCQQIFQRDLVFMYGDYVVWLCNYFLIGILIYSVF